MSFDIRELRLASKNYDTALQNYEKVNAIFPIKETSSLPEPVRCGM